MSDEESDGRATNGTLTDRRGQTGQGDSLLGEGIQG